ncbi:hypothetical protein [Rhodoferax mekongensis]|uniref:hypothetical protein n=1 Tax=Rhodoferax mekongensis TaxID=3068341 RepID=UPI0028BD1AFB|nr:hypothetical protein [Rhodoferax sp. TBRC 17199]MDT7514560.1 hypothetical protein [Rhodoferax sp. TBRC 17199]
MGKSPEQLAQWAAYEAITAKRAKDAAANAAKKRKAELLAAQAKSWEQAVLIRAYVAAVMAAAPTDSTEDERQKLQAWEAEALETAIHADPIPRLVGSLTGRAA